MCAFLCACVCVRVCMCACVLCVPVSKGVEQSAGPYGIEVGVCVGEQDSCVACVWCKGAGQGARDGPVRAHAKTLSGHT